MHKFSYPKITFRIADTLSNFLAGGESFDLLQVEKRGVRCFKEVSKKNFENGGREWNSLRFWPTVTLSRKGVKSSEEQARCRYEEAIEKGDINPEKTPLEEFVFNPFSRVFEGELNRKHDLVFFDDSCKWGTTAAYLLREAKRMGYPTDKVFFNFGRSFRIKTYILQAHGIY
jgi:hypothetical protein